MKTDGAERGIRHCTAAEGQVEVGQVGKAKREDLGAGVRQSTAEGLVIIVSARGSQEKMLDLPDPALSALWQPQQYPRSLGLSGTYSLLAQVFVG